MHKVLAVALGAIAAMMFSAARAQVEAAPGHLAKAKIVGTHDPQTLRAIEALHEQDIAATLANDPRALADLWTQDAVRMEPGGPIESGRSQITRNDERDFAKMPTGAVTTSYMVEIMALHVYGTRAVEWGYFSSVFRPGEGKREIKQRGKFVRVLREVAKGTWRFALVAWNDVGKREPH
jgi:uncharacterized protein (TIGR02246 family)